MQPAIAAMPPVQRRALIVRLQRPLDELVSPAMQARHRLLRLGLMIGDTIALIPWLVFMAITLPSTYTVTTGR